MRFLDKRDHQLVRWVNAQRTLPFVTMKQKYLCSNCGNVTQNPRPGNCYFGDTRHQWIPFANSDTDTSNNDGTLPFKIRPLAAFAGALIMGTVAFFSTAKNKNPNDALIGASLLGLVLGNFYKQVLTLIASAVILFGAFWVLDYFKIVDFKETPPKNPPKVIKVNK